MAEKLTPPQEIEHPRSIYEPRSGEHIETYIAALSAEPISPLSERDKQHIATWNEALAIGVCEVDDKTFYVSGSAEHRSEYDHLGEALNANSYLGTKHEINIDYFTRDQPEVPTPLFNGEITRSLIKDAFLKNALSVETVQLKKMALTSKKAEDHRMAEELAAGNIPTPPERITVFSDATNLMEKLRVLKQYKNYYGSVATALNKSPEDSNVHRAKQLYVDLYRKTVNASLAQTYPDVLSFWYQAKHMKEPQSKLITSAIEASLPLVKDLRADYLTKRAHGLLKRLDYLRNGAAREHHGQYTAISQELVAYLENQHNLAEDPPTPRLSAQEIARFDAEKFDAKDMKELSEYVLNELGLLSTETAFVPKDRKTRAADGKWQVQIRDDIDAMGAEDPPGVFEIPSNFNRNLTKATAPVGVIPGLMHEFGHIIQHDNKRLQGNSGIGSIVKSKNQTVYFEAGGLRNEDRVQRDLFGRTRVQAPHYMRAMMVLESGGSEGEALKAFYDSYRVSNPEETPLAAGKVAVSRVMRLVRLRGGYNSQPLNYAETGLILHKTRHLNDHIKGLLFDYSAFNIGDLADLHQFDLLPKRIHHFPYEKAVDATLDFIRHKLAQRDSEPKSGSQTT